MRVACTLVVLREGSSSLAAQQSRACNGSVQLEEEFMRNEDGYPEIRHFLKVTTQGNRNSSSMEVSYENIREMHLQNVPSGRATFVFRNPPVSVIIMKSEPGQLRRIVRIVRGLVEEPDDDISPPTHPVPEAKEKPLESASMQKSLRVTKNNIRKVAYPSSLETLDVSDVGIKNVDTRWFALSNLTRLDLSNNRLGESPGFVKIKLVSRLQNLASLSLEGNHIRDLPDGFFESLPNTLRVLNLAANNLMYIHSSITKINHLHAFILSRNELISLPRDMSDMRLRHLLVDHNCLTSIPFDIRTHRLDRFYCDSNYFENEWFPEPDPVQEPTLCSQALTVVRRFALAEDPLPWDLKMRAPVLSIKCSMCREWTARDRLEQVHGRGEIDFAGETDMRRRVPMEAYFCRVCIRRAPSFLV
ncbi:hypothetical protein Q1695_010850 [Nippostrongylus brasiliensis]|nr:hypothetical protein Q1695_010850 [Nippostrongylus brasiliensis]